MQKKPAGVNILTDRKSEVMVASGQPVNGSVKISGQSMVRSIVLYPLITGETSSLQPACEITGCTQLKEITGRKNLGQQVCEVRGSMLISDCPALTYIGFLSCKTLCVFFSPVRKETLVLDLEEVEVERLEIHNTEITVRAYILIMYLSLLAILGGDKLVILVNVRVENSHITPSKIKTDLKSHLLFC